MNLSTSSFIIPGFYIAAGITLIVGYKNALIARYSQGDNQRLYSSFSMMCLLICGALISFASYYLSTSIEQAILALKWQTALLTLLLWPYFLFIAAYTHQRNTEPWSIIIISIAIFYTLVDIISQYSLRYTSIDKVITMMFPWGETLQAYRGPVGDFKLLRGLALLIFVWGFYRAIGLCVRGNIKQGFPLLICLAIHMFCVYWGHLIDIGALHSFYIVGFGYLATVILMSHTLAQQIKGQADQNKIAAITFDIQDAIVISDKHHNIVQVNKAFEKITGYAQSEVLGKSQWTLQTDIQNKNPQVLIQNKLNKNGEWLGQLWLKNKFNHQQPNHTKITAINHENGNSNYYVTIYRNLSEIKQAEAYIEFIKAYDTLTGLPNRHTFINYQQNLPVRNASNLEYSALLVINLDNFKIINDTIGHDAGNLVLNETAYRLKAKIADENCLARLVGDEFIIAYNSVNSDEFTASRIVVDKVNSLIDTLNQPYILNKHEYLISASVGITLFQNNKFDSKELIKHAHIAMIEAKSKGGGNVHFFEQYLQDKLMHESSIENELRKAITGNEFQLFLQVQVNNDFSPIGAEALIRWNHPSRGFISPLEFIHIAEQSTMIQSMGTWVLTEACRLLKRWEKTATMQALTLSVNVSAKQFLNPNFVSIVKSTIQQYAIDPSKLKLEITESVVMQETKIVITKLRTLREEVGVKLSLDDFGTGYSSLSSLKNLPLDEVKIDQSFIKNITANNKDAVIAETIIDLAKHLKLNVVAEGVETQAQLALLRKFTCNAFQGFLFSKPLALESFEALIKQQQKSV